MSEDQVTLDEAAAKDDPSPDGKWRTIELGKLAEYQNGSAFSKSQWTDSGYPIIRIQNLTGEQEDFNYYDDELEDRYRIEHGDTLLSWSATIDVFEWEGPEAALNQHIYRVDTTDKVNEIFFRFKLEDLLPQLEALSHGSTMKHVRKADLVNLDADIPPLEEQRKIASVLYTVDQAIQKTEEIINRLERLLVATRRNLMRKGTGDMQLVGSDSRFGKIPKNWELKRLNDVTNVVGGSTPSTEEPKYWNGSIPWATPTDLTELEGSVIEDTNDYITEEGLASASTHLIPPESVLMTSRATIGKCAVNGVEMATNQGFQNLVPSEDVDTWYLYYRIKEEAAYLDSVGSGSTFSEVSKSTVQKIRIPVPPLDEQRTIAKRLRSIDDVRYAERDYRRKLQRVKQGLIQDLLSGEVRTHDKDIEPVDDVLKHG